ncbi:MAG: pyridoxamine 5'-phosphate oxidase family protein [Chloroflexota bacterium]
MGLCAGSHPYVVPVSYGFSEGSIYFHCATRGKKLDVMRENNRVCFQVDEWVEG